MIRFKKTFISVLTVVIGCLFLLLLGSNVFGFGGNTIPGGAGRGSGGSAGHQTNNYADVSTQGAFWITVPVTWDDKEKTVRSIFQKNGSPPFVDLNTINTKKPPTVIFGCKKNSEVYILVTPLTGNGFGAPQSVDIARNYAGPPNPKKKKSLYYKSKAEEKTSDARWKLPKGAKIKSYDEAEEAFNMYADIHKRFFGQKYKGTNLGWFCLEPNRGTPTSTTTTTTTSAVECSARATREWGDTRTRIAVRNASLDGNSWTAKDKRQGLPTDSGWTDEGGTYWTIAKPGDGIQFQHEFCAGDRFVRRTEHQDWYEGDDESHDRTFDITPNKFKIGATPESYAFGNGIEWTNKIGESIDKYEDLFNAPGKPDGVSLTYNGYGVAVPSPTKNSSDYDCSEVAQYNNKNPYHKATYQIPGFDSDAEECNSSKKTGISNPVGSTITQWHDFNRVKAWELYSYGREGDCSCGQNTAKHHGMYIHPDFIDWFNPPKDKNGNITVSKGSMWGGRSEWQCDSVHQKNCNWTCDVCCDAYNRCVYGSYKDYNYKRTEQSNKIIYKSLSRDYGMARKTAHVYVPYNYSTSVSSRSLVKDTVFQGATTRSRFSWKIESRENDKLSDFEYATVTPPNTQVQTVEFLYHPDNQSVEGKEFSRENPEAFFKAKGAIVTNAQTIASGNQNPRGLYKGKKTSKTVTSVVPDNDEWVGYKYCVAVGIFPADSHDDVNGENNSLEMQYTYGAGAMDAGSYWNISGATCRTIAKKPSFEVWNGSVYTNNGVNTIMSHKIVNAKLGSDINAPKDLFGSWTDYAVIAGKEVDGMSSGAMLGFNNSRYNLSGNKGQSTNTINSEHLSPETIANKNDSMGHSNINANTSINMNLERLRSRYSEKARNMAFNETHTNSQPTIVSSKTGMQFAYFDGNLKTSDLGIRNVANGINQTTSRNRNKDLIKGLGDGKNDNTLVIYVRGNLVIDNNICLGEGCLGNGMQLVDYRFSRKTNSAAKLPQVLIFADNINITENVTRVDAWLVANNTLNTCAGYDPNSVVAKDALNRYSEGVCYKTLMVNGPVYASELILPRTAGATHGYSPTDSSNVLYRRYGATGESSDSILGSGTPAEIFNLRADAYLWAYNQAQRYSEAIVTYKRELAPRY